VVWGNRELDPPFAHPVHVDGAELRALLQDQSDLAELSAHADELAQGFSALGRDQGMCIRRQGGEGWEYAMVVIRDGVLVLVRFHLDRRIDEATAEAVASVKLSKSSAPGRAF
jgi:hypothetical protein